MARLRIIGGALSGRRFDVPVRPGTRPTSDRVREALSSALQARAAFEGARVLDLFAGTGALAFEALSRGAAEATLVDRDRHVARTLGRSAETLGLADRVTILARDAFKPKDLSEVCVQGPFDLVLLDPPYAYASRLDSLLGELRPSLAPNAWVVIEHGGDSPLLPSSSTGLSPHASYRYGATAIELLTVQPMSPESTPA